MAPIFRAGYSVVKVRDQLYDEDVVEAEKLNESENDPPCSCTNRNKKWQGPQMDPNSSPQKRCYNATRLYNICQRRSINLTGVDQSLALANTADAPPDIINIDNRHK